MILGIICNRFLYYRSSRMSRLFVFEAKLKHRRCRQLFLIARVDNATKSFDVDRNQGITMIISAISYVSIMSFWYRYSTIVLISSLGQHTVSCN